MIALALAAPTVHEMRRQMDAYAVQADLFELRVDALAHKDIGELLRDRPRPVIITNRASWEGGWSNDEESVRIGILLDAVQRGAEYIDCELAAVHQLVGRDVHPTQLILSSHDFDAMPDLKALHRRCVEAGADIAKVVGTAHSLGDALAVLRFLAQADAAPTIALAMGSKGLLTRLLAPRFGGYLTFAAPDKLAGTAPGQISLTRMREGYRVHELTRQTRIYGCLTVTMSVHDRLAAATHTLRNRGQDAIVVPLNVQGEEIPPIIEECRSLGMVAFAHALPFSPATMNLPLLEDVLEEWV